MATAKMIAPAANTHARTSLSKSRRAKVGMWIAAITVAAVWSVWPSLLAIVAMLRLEPLQEAIVVSAVDPVQLEVQRSVQKHFLRYGVYLPLDDIMFTQRVGETNKDLVPVLQKVCGQAPMVIWVPLVIRIPLVGERSTEWCWKPVLNK